MVGYFCYNSQVIEESKKEKCSAHPPGVKIQSIGGMRSPRIFISLSGQQLAIMTSNAQLQGIILHIFRFFARIGRQTHQNVSIPKNPKILELILCFEASDAQSSFKKRKILKKLELIGC